LNALKKARVASILALRRTAVVQVAISHEQGCFTSRPDLNGFRERKYQDDLTVGFGEPQWRVKPGRGMM